MNNIILTGFSGTGKSTIAKEVSALLDRPLFDTDNEIVRQTGKTITDIFNEDGESQFRDIENRVLFEACNQSNTIIAVGGGAIVNPINQQLMIQSGTVICLEAHTNTIETRLSSPAPADSTGTTVRPLLNGANAGQRINDLKESRQAAYAIAHWTVHTDTLTPKEVAAEVIRAWNLIHRRLFVHESDISTNSADLNPTTTVFSSAGECPIYVGWGLLRQLGLLCTDAGLKSKAYIITDKTVSKIYGPIVTESLNNAGIQSETLEVPPGESSKALTVAEDCYKWLAEHRAERGDFVIAVGGGVVGDLAGFISATFNRGMPLVQVPTSLAAMVDASIGGKNAINLTQGKNLVGLFRQPKFIVADVQSLTTLPDRELLSGWAEAIKHGLILDSALFNDFEQNVDSIKALEQPISTDIIRRSIAIKADVVSRDERETLGIRTLLNYGHTVGHALEAATSYGELLHGEAVSIGMTAAGFISQNMGFIEASLIERQNQLLKRFGLPTRIAEVNTSLIWKAMLVDKKNKSGAITWVLLEDIGSAVLSPKVPTDLVEQALQSIM
ncbi:3-dehydroquinate synthase [SAR202 cluster bacterium AD-802-E10_MRT_200m]|nr:3-dehydroquinate synthase [SAR202 cluster bacterium AD-802-E10_MRT_200m]